MGTGALLGELLVQASVGTGYNCIPVPSLIALFLPAFSQVCHLQLLPVVRWPCCSAPRLVPYLSFMADPALISIVNFNFRTGGNGGYSAPQQQQQPAAGGSYYGQPPASAPVPPYAGGAGPAYGGYVFGSQSNAAPPAAGGYVFGAPDNAAAAAGGGEGEGPKCGCGEVMQLKQSNSAANPGRQFYACPKEREVCARQGFLCIYLPVP